jgi:hypothetical protein
MSDGYRGGFSIGGIIGTICAAIVAMPLFGFTFLMLALGDCAPGTNCWTGWFLLPVDAVIVGAIGFGITLAVNTIAKRISGFRDRQ